MGRLEKIVVLTVLFLVAVILAISLNSGPSAAKTPIAGAGKPAGPRGRNAEVVDPGNAATDASGASGAVTAGADAAQPNGALNSQVTPAGAPAQVPVANAAPNPGAPSAVVANVQPPSNERYLFTREGLEPTSDEAWMTYTWKEGDTFKDLSRRYYNSQLYVSRLLSANEGKNEAKLVAGEKILVSVAPSASIDRATLAKPAKGDAKVADATATKWTGGPYVVKAGDVLGTISQQVYGTSKSWKKIYDANRDVLGDSPNSLKVGMKLRIPE
jgi:nucleoid-associated protein YgaU